MALLLSLVVFTSIFFPQPDLFRRYQGFLAAHVGPQGLGDADAAIGLEVVFQESNEHPGRGDDGVVEGVGKVKILASLFPDPDPQAAGLGVPQVGAGSHLEVFLLPGAPGLRSEERRVGTECMR